MRRSLLSATMGLAFGGLLLTLSFCAFSLASPGWLSALLSGQPVEDIADAFEPVAEAGGVGAQPQPTAPPEPTVAPLPTAAATGACGGPESMVIALLGVDDRGTGYSRAPRTDAISLVNVRFVSKTASLLSIPRDLYVPMPNLESVGITQDRLNTAYRHGEVYDVPGGGPAQLKDTVRLNFGVRVDRYVMVNFGAFESAVDALGGIEVDVPKAIYDPAYPADVGYGTVVFELPAGRQHMDGKTALRYARTRHQDDDYRRIQRQQLVLLAIRDKLFSPEVIPRVPGLIKTLLTLVRTDLSPDEIATLACIGPQIDRAAITAHVIDGTMVIPWTTPGGGRVSVPSRVAITPVIEAFLGQ